MHLINFKQPILIVIALISILNIAFAQEKYHIIHVKGDIRIKGSHAPLKTRDVVTSNQEIVFGDADAMAAAISSTRGRYIIQAKKQSTSPDSEIISLLKNAIFESKGMLSTRGSMNTIFELQNYFTGVHVILGDTASIKINPVSMPMNDANFFYLKYAYEKESINKKLSFSGEKLYLIAEEIYKIDGQLIDQSKVNNVELFYYDNKNQSSQSISQFEIVFPDEKSLIEEIAVIIDLYQSTDKSETIGEIEGYITETYGKVYRSNFEYWIKSNFNL